MDLPIKKGDFPVRYVSLPEGIGSPAPWWRGGLGAGLEVSWFFPASGLAAWPNVPKR